MDREGRAGAGARRDVKGMVVVVAVLVMGGGLRILYINYRPEGGSSCSCPILAALHYHVHFGASGPTHVDRSSFGQHWFLPSSQTDEHASPRQVNQIKIKSVTTVSREKKTKLSFHNVEVDHPAFYSSASLEFRNFRFSKVSGKVWNGT